MTLLIYNFGYKIGHWYLKLLTYQGDLTYKIWYISIKVKILNKRYALHVTV